MIYRYLVLYNPKYGKIMFSWRKIMIMLIVNLIVSHLIFLPYVVFSALGLDEMGVCGVQLRNTFLKMCLQTDVVYIFFGYGLSALCGYMVIKKIKQQSGNVSSGFPV